MKRLLNGWLLMACAGLAMAHGPHAAHEHGVAELRVAIAGAEVEISFETPLDNLVGFEHEPRNDRQRKALQEALEAVGAFERLFGLPAAAGCAMVDVAVEAPFGSQDHHGHAHGHAGVSAVYTLKCATPAALDVLQVKVFDVFSRTRQIRAERLSPRGQTAVTLRSKQADLPL
ncbi:DUF2796 domain-containing protein [Azoarcus communis]|nr:DUF2796 domain-containing protein [Parazoarcus communis]NMG50672.1 DUF2796 domain-containing protein [Parazoarcus communis]NMG72476.1 DUF2796 domain-containing protein [Parazoarcus communis SWub3 = DSM 12120]